VFDILAPTHIALILIVALLVLGPKRLPEVSRSLGKGLRDFRQAMSTYSPEGLLHPDEVHAATAAESDLRREPPVAAGTAHSAPNEPTVDAVAVDDGAATTATPTAAVTAGPTATASPTATANPTVAEPAEQSAA
jgi:TatA/E family protein of Tat protein translocase